MLKSRTHVRRLIAALAVASLTMLGACADDAPTREEPSSPIEEPVEEGAEDADNMADPENEDESDIEDAGDRESSEEESTVSEDDIEPSNN